MVIQRLKTSVLDQLASAASCSLRLARAQLLEDAVNRLPGVRADVGLDQRGGRRGTLGLLDRHQHGEVGEPLADEHVQRAQVGLARFVAGVLLLHPIEPGLDVRDDRAVDALKLRLAGDEVCALSGDGTGERGLQLVDGVDAARGLLQPLACLLQPFLARAGQEEQRRQEADDQERRNGDVPPSETVERLTQDVYAAHLESLYAQTVPRACAARG